MEGEGRREDQGEGEREYLKNCYQLRALESDCPCACVVCVQVCTG